MFLRTRINKDFKKLHIKLKPTTLAKSDFHSKSTKGPKFAWLSYFQKWSNNNRSLSTVKLNTKTKVSDKFRKATSASKVTASSINKKLIHTLVQPLISIRQLFSFVVSLLLSGVNSIFWNFSRESVLKVIFIGVFGILIISLLNLQVVATQNFLGQSNTTIPLSIIPSTRGSIFIRDLKAGNRPIEVTSSRVLFNVFFEPRSLQSHINQKLITKDQAATILAGTLNLPYSEVQQILDEELSKTTLSQYRLLKKFVSKEQKMAVDYLRAFGYGEIQGFSSWLGVEQVEVRSYPEEEFLGSLGAVLGYVQREPVTREEALKIPSCADLVRQNEQRNTVNSFSGRPEDGRYIVGLYGIEQKFCTELGGLNGRELLGSEIGLKNPKDLEVVHGADIFLTIDRNLQTKAQEVLDDLVKQTTNTQGKPKDGTIVIMDLKRNPGAILAMANYPKANPNEYYKGLDGFRNTATSVDYEVGSVMKPITVAIALNEYLTGQTDAQGRLRGVSPDQKFLGYDERGKPYLENNGNVLYIKNADGVAYLNRGPQTISNCLRDSINTCVADIQATIGNTKTKEYFENRFLIGQPTLIALPGDTFGNIRAFQENIFSDFTYATFAFGQGFTMSPIQLMRSYTPLANKGKLIEPYLVDKMIDSKNYVIDSRSLEAPDKIRQKAQIQIIEPDVARLVTDYLVNTIDQGYLGLRSSKGRVPGYTVAGKTGTAQVSRPYNGAPCDYTCNTARGIYDHTFIGYAPARDPEIMILIKLSEPNPGVIRNYAENTLGPSFSHLMGWSLEYLGVPKEPGR